MRRPAHPTRAAVALIAALAALALSAGPAAAAPSALGDFDGDGFSDLAVGAPEDSVSGQEAAGAVNVIYGSARGLTAAGDQQFTKSPQNIAGVPQPGARFGAALAAGDVDGDGFGDLAIGAPGEDVGALTQAPGSGAVTVLYGSSRGLRPQPGDTAFSQNSRGVGGNAETGDSFGAALAIGDLDGDGFGDLAIGVPGDSVDGQAEAGAVHVLYGRSSGLTETGSQLWTQNTPGIKGISGTGHRFGAELAAGDVSRNGREDLAIGIPGAVVGGDAGAGAALVLYGRRGGLSATDDLWSQDARGIKGSAERNDGFGLALAIGDFDGDGIGDLAAGSPRDSVNNAAGAGAVNVIYGSDSGLREDPDQFWTQATDGIKSRASIGETFGRALVAADFSRNGADELAIGVPGQDVGGAADAGAVTVLYGNTGAGLSERADQFWSQDTRGVEGRAESADRFGSAVGSGDFDGDGAFDLAVGVPRESFGGSPDAGAVNTLHGSDRGLREDPDRVWSQGSAGIAGAVGNDGFGFALASGLADGD